MKLVLALVIGALLLAFVRRHSTPRPSRGAAPRPRSLDVDTLALDAAAVLDALHGAETDQERHLSRLRALLGPSLALRFSGYVRFLREHGYVTLDAPAQSLALTAKGTEAARLDDVQPPMLAEVERHFADDLARGFALQHDEAEERRRLALELER